MIFITILHWSSLSELNFTEQTSTLVEDKLLVQIKNWSQELDKNVYEIFLD